MRRLPTAPLVVSGLVGGYLVARETGVRPLGGAVLAGMGAAAATSWLRNAGTARTGVLLAAYLGGFGASHPLAKKIGAWPSVLAVSAASGGLTWLLADRAPHTIIVTPSAPEGV